MLGNLLSEIKIRVNLEEWNQIIRLNCYDTGCYNNNTEDMTCILKKITINNGKCERYENRK